MPASLFRFSFLCKSKLVARKQGRCAEKASAQLFRIADFGFFWFSFSIRIPQSAVRNLEAGLSGAQPGAPTWEELSSWGKNGLPGRSKKRGAPHGFCAQRPCFRAGQCLKFNSSSAYLAKSGGARRSRSFFSSPPIYPMKKKPYAFGGGLFHRFLKGPELLTLGPMFFAFNTSLPFLLPEAWRASFLSLWVSRPPWLRW